MSADWRSKLARFVALVSAAAVLASDGALRGPVIGTQPNREDVADEVVIEVLRSLTPATPAELARREP